MRLEKSFVQKDNNVDVVQLEVLFYEDIQSIYKKNITLEVKPFLMILILMHNSFFKIYLVSILRILKYMYHENNFLK